MSARRATQNVDEVLGALADPTRRALFEATLKTPGLTTSQLSDRVPQMTRWGVIKHLAVLRDANLIQTMLRDGCAVTTPRRLR
jgi:DNA-binding transcriptional ArsR family regulator